jgi:hypothetical protein
MTMGGKEKGHASFLTFVGAPHLRRFFLGKSGVAMTDLQSDDYSQFIASIFAELGVNPPFTETVLLRDRRFVGRKFRAGGIQIVWWVVKNVVEVFDEDGQVVESIELEQKLGKSA